MRPGLVDAFQLANSYQVRNLIIDGIRSVDELLWIESLARETGYHFQPVRVRRDGYDYTREAQAKGEVLAGSVREVMLCMAGHPDSLQFNRDRDDVEALIRAATCNA
jgi:hypothetical protein